MKEPSFMSVPSWSPTSILTDGPLKCSCERKYPPNDIKYQWSLLLSQQKTRGREQQQAWRGGPGSLTWTRCIGEASQTTRWRSGWWLTVFGVQVRNPVRTGGRGCRWLAWLVERVTLDLGVLSWRPMLAVEILQEKMFETDIYIYIKLGVFGIWMALESRENWLILSGKYRSKQRRAYKAWALGQSAIRGHRGGTSKRKWKVASRRKIEYDSLEVRRKKLLKE